MSIFEKERKNASFQKAALSEVLYGSKEALEAWVKRQELVANDPTMKFNPIDIQKSREEVSKIYARKTIRYHQAFESNTRSQREKSILFSEQTPLALHEFMFLATLENLCSEKQVEMFLQPAKKGQILGCYAQTELGHGSDVQSLMTTAEYDVTTETFVMNSPCVEAAKWWIGDLGIYANHACVFAQLIIRGKNYGVHSFIVPIRDKVTHKPFEGIEVGDIGPKYGYNNKDNGYLLMKSYRIPRMNMLMKYQKVSRTGEYERRGNEKISYATMLLIRAVIPLFIYYNISKAVTILTRYSIFRTQFKDKLGIEMPILNYQIQQQKVIPRIAETYAIFFGHQTIDKLSTFVFEEARDHARFDQLNEAHTLTSCTKAIFTKDGLRGLETLRRAAGGHGFSMYSAIPNMIQELTPTFTYEGEFTVLMLQVARFLMKCLKHLQEGKRLPESAVYLEEFNSSQKFTLDCTLESLRNPQILRQAFLYHSVEKLRQTSDKMMKGVSEGLSMQQSWNSYANLNLIESASAHAYFWIYQNFYRKVSECRNEAVKNVLYKLLLLYGSNVLIDRANYFYETGTITSNSLTAVHDLKAKLLAELRPDVLTIVEAFEYHDNTLMSAIGTADGKVYENLLEWAKNHNEVNQQPYRSEIIAEIKKAKASLKKIAAKL